MRLSSPVTVMATARNKAAATRANAVLAKPLNAIPSPALVPIRTVGLVRLGEVPSRKAISAAITTADTA